ncbi:hypothetical protein [Bowmanella dokdonensis]|nr:hypothetical protein [Bowmanella dokdonensis]
MQQDQQLQDPFNVKYLLAALVTLVALPLLHVICGWFVYYL